MGLHLRFGHKIVLAASAIVLVVFSSFAVISESRQRDEIRKSVQQFLQAVGSDSASSISHWIAGRTLLVENLAQAAALSPHSQAVAPYLSLQSMKQTFIATFVGWQDGAFVTFPDDPMPAGYDPRSRPWYELGMAASGVAITEPYADSITRELLVSIVDKVQVRGQVLAVAGADVALKSVVDIINAADLKGMGYAFLVSGDGKVLVHPDPSMSMRRLDDVVPGAQPSLLDRLQEVSGGKELLMFIPVRGLPSLDWRIGLVVDKQKAYAPIEASRRVTFITLFLAVLVVIALLGALVQRLLLPLRTMSNAMHDIAQGEGDLTVRLANRSNDEFGALAQSFNRFVGRVHESMQQVASATKAVDQGVRAVTQASEASLSSSSEQSTRTSSVVTAIQQLGAATQDIAQNAALASQRTVSARDQAASGYAVLTDTIAAIDHLTQLIGASGNSIDSLHAKTAGIGQILDVITGISQQTNLLALNAAIEAARAGEAGRGFAVVADEVRSLAHRTQQSARQVQQLIEELQEEAQRSVGQMQDSQHYGKESIDIAQKAGVRLGSITTIVGEIDGINHSVAAATEEQSTVADLISSDTTELDLLNRKGVENLRETLDACARLQQQVESLRGLVSGFRL
ncbi:methyl-accepting chemotaxis protein [Pseudomonas taiwanensis]|uniref:Methyl-accepting chemotaxis protein n=2 Tax=Pseudomonas taiwanensis TaxID=470150 RepID=A0ABR6V5A4_9PSED|nr:methyl-accepting chemotaxis protein [Pseudomonas taiwanensis]MBC3475683.1 methyl-accepting chemotaxis protein [Pseudomonas taiwanensis]